MLATKSFVKYNLDIKTGREDPTYALQVCLIKRAEPMDRKKFRQVIIIKKKPLEIKEIRSRQNQKGTCAFQEKLKQDDQQQVSTRQ